MVALIYMTPYYNTNLQLNLLYWCKEIVHPKINISWKFPLQAFQDTDAMFWSYDVLIMEMCHQSILKKKKLHTTYLSSFYQIFILSQGWTLWHSWSKSRAFAAVGKCTRSENPAQEMRTLLVYWSVPYKILTECTLIADMKGASIHTYIHPLDMKREKKYGADWRINLSRSNPLQKNQARYYDLFKCFQLKHLLKYCSMGYLTSKAVRDHWANKSWMTPYCCQYFMYHFVPKNLLVPETRLRRLLQLMCKLMWSYAKQPLGIKWTTMKWNVHGVAYPATH